MPDPQARPLAGVRVLDLSNVLAGPFCCLQLAHLGATVTKVEPPDGDLARRLGADATLNQEGMGLSFLAQNAGKRSVALNLKADGGPAVLGRLARHADVLVESFRPGVLERLGVGVKWIREQNPELVVCSVTGFGQDGPLAGRPAYDQVVQGLAGAMAITGDPDGQPTRTGWPVADTVGGLTAAMAVCAALNARTRGCHIDVAMLDALLTTMGWVVSNFLNGGIVPARRGNDNMTASPSGTFPTATGPLNIAANKDDQWRALVGCLGLPHLAADPRFSEREARLANRAALAALLAERLRARPAEEWEADLNAAGVPAGAVLGVPEALATEQVAGRGLVGGLDVPGLRDGLQAMQAGFLVDGTRPAADTPPPRLGADTDAVLAEAGYDKDKVARLREQGVVA